MELHSDLVGTALKPYRREITGRETMNYAAAVGDDNPCRSWPGHRGATAPGREVGCFSCCCAPITGNLSGGAGRFI
jgi:hypothetical protein